MVAAAARGASSPGSGRRYQVIARLDAVITDRPELSVEAFREKSGWELRAEGACRGEICIPLHGRGVGPDGDVDVLAVADELGMPVVHDEEHGLWAIGSAAPGGRALESVSAPDLVLDDFDGRTYELASSRGRKVLLLAWASW